MIRVHRVWAHDGALSRAASNARTRWETRRALVVELVDELGCRGQGEAAPLEGYSPDRFEDVERALDRLVGLEVVSPRGEGLPPSARSALETAWLDLSARRTGQSVPALLGVPSTIRVPICGALQAGALEVQLAEAQLAWNRGLRSLKVKIGRGGEWPREIELLAALRSRFGAELRLRVDANGAFQPIDLPDILGALEPFDLELFEEPVSGAAWARVAPTSVPLAADESLQSPAPEVLDAFARGVIQVAVLKPTTLGGPLRCLEIATRLAGLGARCVVGHAFEGPLGLTASAALALALAARASAELASGLDRHLGLSAWPPVELPFAAGGELHAWEAAGLGVEIGSP